MNTDYCPDYHPMLNQARLFDAKAALLLPPVSSPSTSTKSHLISKASLSLKGGRAAINGTEGQQAGAKQGSDVAVANPSCKTGQPG